MVIRLHGLDTLPSGTTFTINPVEVPADEAVAGVGWPTEPLLPVEQRAVPQGYELVIGPEIVDNPALQPGMPVVIEVAAANVRGEVLWPNVSPLGRQRLHAIVPPAVRRLPLEQPPHDLPRPETGLSELSRRAPIEAVALEPVPPSQPDTASEGSESKVVGIAAAMAAAAAAGAVAAATAEAPAPMRVRRVIPRFSSMRGSLLSVRSDDVIRGHSKELRRASWKVSGAASGTGPPGSLRSGPPGMRPPSD